MTPEIVDLKTIHDGWGRFLLTTIRLNNGQLITREIEDHGNAVGVLPYDPVRRTAILIKQFRAPMFYATRMPQTLEVVAGGIVGDDPTACVKREALEEAGLKLYDVEHVCKAMNMPGVSTMCIDLYLATYGRENLISSGGGLPDENENISVMEIELADLVGLFGQNGLVDLSTAFLVQTLRLQRPDLFVA